MNTGNLIIGVISIIVLASPFVFNYLKGQKRKNNIVKKLKEYAQNIPANIEESEFDYSIILAIDKAKKIAFWGKISENNVELKHVLLTDFSSCKIVRGSSADADSGTNLLEIGFYPKDKKNAVENFVLFDDREGGRIAGELLLGNKWVDIFNKYM